ncbi:hypothetical protein [Bacillus anthracis]
MKYFDDVVNEVTDEYGVDLSGEEMRKIFESLSPDLRWEGTYYGWHKFSIKQDVIASVHKYMQERESC